MAEWSKALYPAMAGRAANETVVEYIMAYVYILQDKIRQRRYIGSCLELSTRIARHNQHTGGKTTHVGHWALVCHKACTDMTEARSLEKLVKSYKGGNALKRILSGEVDEWNIEKEI